ncbi:hypothetical protein SNE40_022563 [Patella caerulea]|uniref:RRM domain-containing protein n=1 Tax=Patella caerulea TaxID=87958 RepID=A0AAN8FWM5_PATCE
MSWRHDQVNKIYVGDLPRDVPVSERELKQHFSYYGRLRSVWVSKNPVGFAFVKYENHQDAADAVDGLNGASICGVRIRVEHSTGGTVKNRACLRNSGEREVTSNRGTLNNFIPDDDRFFEYDEHGNIRYDSRQTNMIDKKDVRGSRLVRIKTLITQDPNIINDTTRYPTLLGEEAGQGNVDCVDFLLKSGALVDLKDSEGETATCRCLKASDDVSTYDKLMCLMLLIKAGANLYDGHNEDGMTPLMIAASVWDDLCLKEILKVGYLSRGNVKWRVIDDNYYKYRRSVYSGQRNKLHIYHQKYRTTVDYRDENGRNALHHCIRKNTSTSSSRVIACIHHLNEAGCSFTLKSNFSVGSVCFIEQALQAGSGAAVVKYLIDLGLKVNLNRCLQLATINLDLTAMKILLEAGADLRYKRNNCTILHMALLQLIQSEFYTLTSLPSDLNPHSEMKPVLKFLLENNLDPNTVCQGGGTPLLYSCWYRWYGYRFPLDYFVSENVSIQRFTYGNLDWCYEFWVGDDVCTDYDVEKKLELLKFLYDCGLTRTKCLTFKGGPNPDDVVIFGMSDFVEEPDSVICEWLDNMSATPPSLMYMCKHNVRQLLGRNIKNKVLHLGLPLAAQNAVLLKDILSSDCFDD